MKRSTLRLIFFLRLSENITIRKEISSKAESDFSEKFQSFGFLGIVSLTPKEIKFKKHCYVPVM